MKTNEILPLTSLRFFTAFYVFIFHMHIRWPLTSNKFFSSLFYEGAIGMSFFFILSGFVLLYRYHNFDFTKDKAIKTYIIHRFSRIYPIYLVIAIATFYWIGISMESHEPKAILYYLARLVFIILTNILLLQAWIPQLFDYWNDGGSWSISVEAFFYTTFPFIIKFIKTGSIAKVLSIGLIAYIFSMLCGLSLVLFDSPGVVRTFYMIPIFRIPEFIIGMVAGIISVNNKKLNKINCSGTLIISTFTMIIYLMLFGSPNTKYLQHNFIILPLETLIIFSAANCEDGLFRKVLSNKFFVLLGHASYSFYSCQSLIILNLIHNYQDIVRFAPFLENHFLLFVVSFCCLTIMSIISYFYIESPLRHRINKKFITN